MFLYAADKGSGSWKKTAGIVAVAGGALILGCSVGLFLYMNRRKRRQQSSLLSQSISSDIYLKNNDTELFDATYHTHIFSYEELKEATDSFNESRELGDGGFGTVYKGELKDGRTVAVKRLFEKNYRRLEQFMNEIEILSCLRHPNIVALYGCTSRHSRELLLVYEFISNGTLADHLHGPLASKEAISWPIRISIAIQTADALAYLHSVEPQIIHRDVKTSNILLDKNFHVKVADFGLSRLFPLDVTHASTAPQGTPGYVDPEYHQCYQLTDRSDVYSFGVVLIELISSKPAVDISRNRHEKNLANMAITKIQNRQIDQLVDFELGYQSDLEINRMIDQVAELAFQCLQSERDMRPSIREVFEILKKIEGGGYNADKKNVSSLISVDTVIEKWPSRSTTSNSSS
ncbi:LEAF RUST 10 DISEASE-RESISTANCE LOCUS RECEPTOR-LIKE PROTEIN KINASE-like 1.2 [Asparagus officinalis]|uniref:LEAF RUST 10 DISEASE-RESISTANCE LOCUS RECEPTOR-LIKE PROTEIN KINASE-like 1.2 n=1 Tax=Asparagus officinalis TaxID=4686 RepID=UPI00098DF117|nr:LEAF RUST 10 DISEASE-RESISTANCE LOCUS RECEPTOR-LIKE PROTEIN KINASE-like 1.2 [Asparagus officinalis]